LRFYTTIGARGSQFVAAEGNRIIHGKILVTMLVSRMVMAKNSSFYGKNLMAGSPTAAYNVLDIKDPKFLCAELWFRVFHNVPFPSHSYRMLIEPV